MHEKLCNNYISCQSIKKIKFIIAPRAKIFSHKIIIKLTTFLGLLIFL